MGRFVFQNLKISKKKLAYLIGLLTGKGHISLKQHSGLVAFYSSSSDEVKKFANVLKKCFGIIPHVYFRYHKPHRFKVYMTSLELAKFFLEAGAPVGDKTSSVFRVPKWIRESKKSIHRFYLEGIFDSQGSVYLVKQGKKTCCRIEIENYKSVKLNENNYIFMSQLRNLMRNIGIETSEIYFRPKKQRKDRSFTQATRVFIKPDSFANFYKEIGFNDLRKRRLLREFMRR